MNLPTLPTNDLLAVFDEDPAGTDREVLEQRRSKAAAAVESFASQASLTALDSLLEAVEGGQADAGRQLRLLADQMGERTAVLNQEVARFLSLNRED